MSLFSVYYDRQSDVDPGKHEANPKKVNINGEVVGSFFSGKIEMSYQNDTEEAYEYTIVFENIICNACIHDFEILLDENPIKLKGHENHNVDLGIYLLKRRIKSHEYEITPREYPILNRDNYLIIKYVFPNQILKIMAEFEMPIQYTSRSTFEIFFPLSCCGYVKSHILKCDDFHFSCKFNSLPLKSNSISSNPDGKLNLQESTYIIDHLDPEILQLNITYDLNPPKKSKNQGLIQMPIKSFLFEDGYAFCCGKYASITFLPTKKDEEDHSGEEFIFLIDCSESMSSGDIELASQSLMYFIKLMPKNCFFNVIRFGYMYIPLFPKPVPYTEENAQKALEFAANLKPDLGKTYLFDPLIDVLTTDLSKMGKSRHVFIITDGQIPNSNGIIEIIKQASSTTKCNVIGLGCDSDRSLIQEIGQTGFVDFALSGDDMRSKVIGLLDKNLNGTCKVDISFGIVSNIDISPPLSEIPFNKPTTFFIKSSNDFPEKFDIKIKVEGNDKPMNIHANSLPADSKINKTLEYLFVNQNLKYLSNSVLTEKTIRKIAQQSIEYKISSYYNTFSGVLEYKSPEEEQRIKKLISDFENQRKLNIAQNKIQLLQKFKSEYDAWLEEVEIFVKLISGKYACVKIPLNLRVEDLKHLLEYESTVRRDRQRLIFAGKTLEDEYEIQDYGIRKDYTLHLVLRL